VDGEEACGPRGEVIRERGDERHGGEHGPGFEGFEPEAMEAVERSRAAACAAGWGLRGKQASEASEWGSRPMAAGRHGGNPGGWGGRRESDARSQASHGRGGAYDNGGGGGQEPADEKWMSGGESPGPWRKPPGLRIRGVEQLNETASPRGEVESIRT
jgi:hypothetical protein